MPLLGLGKERLNPDLTLADGFLVRLRGVICPNLLDVLGIERAMDDAASVASGALGLDRASIAGVRVGAIDGDRFCRFDPLALQRMVFRAAESVLVLLVGERIPTVEPCSVFEIGQR